MSNRVVAEADKGDVTEPTVTKLKHVPTAEWKKEEDDEGSGLETMDMS